MIIQLTNIACKAIVEPFDSRVPKYDTIIPMLRKYMRVKYDGYQYMQRYRARQWDGYKHFITTSGLFATGYLELVINFLRKHFPTLEIKIRDERANLPPLQMEEELYSRLPNGWELRDYQKDLVRSIDNSIDLGEGKKIYFPRGIIDAATNAGKNAVCAGVYSVVKDCKLLFLIHSREIFSQAVEFFTSLYGNDVGRIGGGYYQWSDFTIAMVKTLYNRVKKSYNTKAELAKVNTLIVDEAHHSGGNEYSKLLQNVNAGVRLFVSGTPLSNVSKINNMIVVGLSGTVLGTVTNEELINKGVSQKPTVNLYHAKPSLRAGMCLTYAQEVFKHIYQNEQRAAQIAKFCCDRSDKSILIVFTNIRHGYLIHRIIQEQKLFTGRVEIVHGKSAYRAQTIKNFINGDINVLLSSIILKEGVNIPNINTLILAGGGKSVISIKQFIGRALRDDGFNKEVEIIDLYDTGRFLEKHSKARLKIYAKEGFAVNMN